MNPGIMAAIAAVTSNSVRTFNETSDHKKITRKARVSVNGTKYRARYPNNRKSRRIQRNGRSRY